MSFELIAPETPSTAPSPPPLDTGFASTVRYDHISYSSKVSIVFGEDSAPLSPSMPTSDWKVGLRATCLPYRYSMPFLSRELPPDVLPFSACKDIAVYTIGGCDRFEFLDCIYHEWHPTQDRDVFKRGVLESPVGLFFSFTLGLYFRMVLPQPPTLLVDVVRWHIMLLQQHQALLPRFLPFYGCHRCWFDPT
ncbi:hypothetical protein BS50DRAFT_593767 [Corynespora cassiicola Philippines]|uniref:Uncharacterized protein n=1 Tax=Corynespora cassiicola Philippines TaxID=1448308 RepID=A0A2T2N5H2_CORCC|nr:hypothetical protein BS50DRAFT_593767 [Corynespora cassiicola Philippines]